MPTRGRPSSESTAKRAKAASFWLDKDVVSVEQFDEKEAVFELFELANAYREGTGRFAPAKLRDVCAGKVVACAFMEPSTRTSCSFAAAAQRLGAGVIYVNSSDSSVTKGETLSDTAICLASYADLIVLRHPKLGAAAEAAAAISKPLVNAGDGTGEHPTQALLDFYTISRQVDLNSYSETNKLNVTFLGDAKNGRTIHSLSKLLTKMMGNCVRVRYVTPEAENLRMPADIIAKLSEAGVEQSEHSELSDDILRVTDVLYVTRVQKERFADSAAYERAMKGSFRVNADVMRKMKETAMVMHPLPRVDEIATEVDSDPRCAYFKQMENGMYVRMALLAMVMGCA